ncbi:MAG TPA: murein L,D-transpeptidase family protein [Xanthobacteraceae bacterium]|nr:murein L,D-transpeptidase family protein [Xanthobacteraceae bacterium]
MIFRLICARTLMASAACAVSLWLAGCDTDSSSPAAKSMKPLSPQMLSELERRNMPKESPILVRLFKEESEVEVWKQDTSGRFALLKAYPICRWSGELGPKTREGDRQAPEGFYTINPGQMNPNSHYYLSFDIGYPNAYDKVHGFTGSNLMVHGDCSSRGCYAMTDEQISEIYGLARESFFGGQRSFQVQAYPFRMTPLNMARHRNNPNMAFWKALKVGNDHFELTHLEPKVDFCEKHYVFDAEPLANAVDGSSPSLSFNPAGRCPAYQVSPALAAEVAEKTKQDEAKTAELISQGTAAAPVRTGTDGGTHPVFLAKLHPHLIRDADGTVRAVVEPNAPASIFDTFNPPHPPQVAEATTGSVTRSLAPSSPAAAAKPPQQPEQPQQPQQADAGSLFTRLFRSEPAQPAPAQKSENGLEPAKSASPKAAPPAPTPKPVVHAPAPSAAANTTPAKPQQKPQEDAQANESPVRSANNTSGLLNGAQPVVPTGTFDSRWSGLRDSTQ